MKGDLCDMSKSKMYKESINLLFLTFLSEEDSLKQMVRLVDLNTRSIDGELVRQYEVQLRNPGTLWDGINKKYNFTISFKTERSNLPKVITLNCSRGKIENEKLKLYVGEGKYLNDTAELKIEIKSMIALINTIQDMISTEDSIVNQLSCDKEGCIN